MSLYDRVFLESDEGPSKLSAAEMHAFTRSFDSGKFKSQRFGQAFINHHGARLGIKTAPRLFYEKDRKAAESHIWNNHIGEDHEPFLDDGNVSLHERVLTEGEKCDSCQRYNPNCAQCRLADWKRAQRELDQQPPRDS